MALPRGFRFTSPLASDERRERNAQGRNCFLSSSGRGKIQNSKKFFITGDANSHRPDLSKEIIIFWNYPPSYLPIYRFHSSV